MLVRTRIYFCLFAFLTLGSTSELSAQVKQIIYGPDRPWEYEFSVDPAAETQPSLRFRILPDPLSRKPGNAVMSFHRALLLFSYHSEKDQKEFEECTSFGLMIRPTETGADAKPVESVSIDRVKAVVHTFADVLHELRVSAFCEDCDWGGQDNDAIDSMNTYVSVFATARQMTRLLGQKARLAIVNRDYDGAFETIQVAFQLGRNLAKCPKFIPALIGAAISKDTQVLLMEIVAESESPNLYWALASAPSPFIDIRPGWENELNLVLRFPIIRDAERPHTQEEWHRLYRETSRLLTQYVTGNAPPQSNDSDAKLPEELQASIDREFPRAKAELARLGLPPDKIAAMPALQVIAMHEANLVRLKRDGLLKLIFLPYHQADPLVDEWDLSLRGLKDSNRPEDFKEVIPLFKSLFPEAHRQYLRVTNSLDRVLVRTRVIEAIRMHAAANDGNPPNSLSEITLVPIPIDPTTGKPVIYRLDGNSAVLEFPSNRPGIASLGEIVRLTIRKDKQKSAKATVD